MSTSKSQRQMGYLKRHEYAKLQVEWKAETALAFDRFAAHEPLTTEQWLDIAHEVARAEREDRLRAAYPEWNQLASEQRKQLIRADVEAERELRGLSAATRSALTTTP